MQEEHEGPVEATDFNMLVATLAEDEFFQDFMTQVARETVDGDKELFEDLLNRVLNDHREESITWL